MDLHYLEQALQAYKAGQYDLAFTLLKQMLDQQPDDPETLLLIAHVEVARRQFTQAIEHLQKLVQLQPGHVQAGHDLAQAYFQSGEARQALRQVRETIKLKPRSVEILNNLAGLLEQLNQPDEALRCYRKAIALASAQPIPHFNAGDLLCRLGKAEEATTLFRIAATLDPNFQEAWAALGATLLENNQADAALGALRRAVQLRAKDTASGCHLGDALQQLRRFEEALSTYDQVLAVTSNHTEALYGMGRARLELGQTVRGIEAFERCVSTNQSYLPAVHDLGKALFQMGCVEKAVPLLRRAATEGSSEIQARALENLAVIVPGSPLDDNATILQTRQNYARTFSVKVSPQQLRKPVKEPIRVGYVSSFFHRANWMKPVWALINHHDRTRFIIHLFSDSRLDLIKEGYRRHPDDQVHEISSLSNTDLAGMIRRQSLDLLVDLNSYSAPKRLGLYPLRPAPVLVAWFNLYGPSGFEAFDYLIGDHSVIPESEDRFYTEKILRVAHSYLTFEVDHPVPEILPPPVLHAKAVTIGSLASQYKLTDQVIADWSEILNKAPASRLLLRNGTLGYPEHIRHLQARFSVNGISDDRLILLGPADHIAFLDTYNQIDFALDPYPYSGGTTTMEALWQGVPVITFNGDRWAGRTSVSLLNAAGLSEFVAADRLGYIDLAVKLATSPDTPSRLVEFRQTIRERLRSSPVCDAQGFAREMESIYRRILEVSN